MRTITHIRDQKEFQRMVFSLVLKGMSLSLASFILFLMNIQRFPMTLEELTHAEAYLLFLLGVGWVIVYHCYISWLGELTSIQIYMNRHKLTFCKTLRFLRRIRRDDRGLL